MKLAPENEKPGIIYDHEFYPASDNKFLCGFTKEDGSVCRLAEAAHTRAMMSYRPAEGTPHRCPDCVTTNEEVCTHNG